MTDRHELLRRADAIVSHGDHISYPSRTSAQHIRDVVRDLAAAIRATDLGWQSMDTAPKDGSKFLATMHDGREPPNLSHQIIKWNTYGGDRGAWMNGFGSEYAPDAELKGWARPLRWKPLPALFEPTA